MAITVNTLEGKYLQQLLMSRNLNAAHSATGESYTTIIPAVVGMIPVVLGVSYGSDSGPYTLEFRTATGGVLKWTAYTKNDVNVDEYSPYGMFVGVTGEGIKVRGAHEAADYDINAVYTYVKETS